jgi:hypothetical protein
MRRPALLGCVALLLAPPAATAAAAAAVDRTGFRYTRALGAAPGPTLLEPDKPLHAHARAGFADLRVVDATGRQVPWRPLPTLDEPHATPVPLLNRGREGGKAVALIDLGPVRRVHDRIELDLPDRRFVGAVTVLGSDDRSRFTRLSTTQIYDVGGARPARSTTAVFPPTDHRYLRLEATGVAEILGATVAFDPARPALEPVEAESRVVPRPGATRVSLDVGYPHVPVDALRVRTSTARFDRPVTVSGSNDGRTFVFLADGRVTRFSGVSLTEIPVAARHRYLRVEIGNGDDPPLEGLRVEALARPRTLLLQEGFRPPYRLYYGDPGLRPPEYDFAALPRGELDLGSARPGRLGAERPNPAYEPPPDTRSFAERHPAVLQGALVLAALAVAAGGLLALRRRT